MIRAASQPTSSDFLAPPLTEGYIPTIRGTGWYYLRSVPPFSLHTVQSMLTDAHIVFGLWIIKGPILSNSRFYIDCQNPEVKEFLVKNITRFWRNGATAALKAVEWGYSVGEVMYRVREKKIHFDYLRDVHSLDCRALVQYGKVVGSTVRNIRLGNQQHKGKVALTGPHCLWHTQQRHSHPVYGLSRLYGAYFPWIEGWGDGGYRDARRLYFHKYAFDGGTMYHPPGFSKLDTPDGSGIAMMRSNKDIAREMLEKKKTGATLTLPNVMIDGQRGWEYEPGSVTAPPSNLFDYGEDLKLEKWEGMGIPPEVAQSEGTGAYAGRRIPQVAFYAILQEIMYNLIRDFDTQVLRPLVRFNFGRRRTEYEIQPFGLLLPSQGQEKRSMTNQMNAMGDGSAQEMNTRPSVGGEGAQMSLETAGVHRTTHDLLPGPYFNFPHDYGDYSVLSRVG